MFRTAALLACFAATLTLARAEIPVAEIDAALKKKVKEKVADVELFSDTLRTGVAAHPEIELLLRLPQSLETIAAKLPLGAPLAGAGTKGVLVYCTWEDDVADLRKFLQSRKHPVVKWADERGLAIITFDTATMWKKRTSTRALSPKERSRQDYDFDRIASVWERGARGLCSRHGLSDEGFLLYGMSRGAHYAHRLVVRAPERFDAVHLHVGNSYDLPEKHADRICWLITTGNHDAGFDEAWRYYQSSREAGHPILFRSFFGMGHGSDGRVTEIRNAFFDYVLDLRENNNRPLGISSAFAAGQLLAQIKESPWVADSINGLVYPKKRSGEIPISQQIPIPNRELAEQWGRVLASDDDKKGVPGL